MKMNFFYDSASTANRTAFSFQKNLKKKKMLKDFIAQLIIHHKHYRAASLCVCVAS
jgi:hypothetical protein